MLGSCRRQGINPFEYLKNLFTRLPVAKMTEIQEFTPSQWVTMQSARLVQAA
ncbi:MAG TPA: transposase domain-containing protein [Verrucomicrobiae bacterium]|nr:transposase domain-containing protein [Verrucomicrobiae bacterium]